jgi:hypothetical protein
MVADEPIFMYYNESRRESGSYYLIAFAILHQSCLEFRKKDSKREREKRTERKIEKYVF